ncbi:ABC transporter ATP-binding protein [Corynebacterium qintianiae]|uniref:ABC transporter ATP-binding protein n=1 Tax=Corynebacterium qintianiae TaxID=2709392 RepID=A0A7T0KN46_9CORY|nr:ABC transporter ATP-binding protein [Corynebacterium qintianiae]QPK83215.1 ABC transporter ATP-binding protein [Corynebacterium qintianiae]
MHTKNLEMNNVTVTYPDGDRTLTALDNVSFTADPGHLTFIVGESGSGKSTLLSAAAGLITPTSGEVLVCGEPVDDKVRLDKIGMIFQQANLIKALNVREQLLVTDHMRGRSPRRDRADELLAAVGLEGLGDRKMEQLSGGQRQRVGIARALMGEPQLVLADEPTAALDSERSHEIVALLRTLIEENNIAGAFVTHDRSLISERDRVVEVRDGRVTSLEHARV